MWPNFEITLGPAYSEQKETMEISPCKWMLVVTELFNKAPSDFDAKKHVCYNWTCKRYLVLKKIVP